MNGLLVYARTNRRELERFLKFSVVGTIGAVVDFGMLYLLHAVVGLPIALANTLSFTAAVMSNFAWNRTWTYPDSRSKRLRKQLTQFFAVNLAGWAINTTILLTLRYPCVSLVRSLSAQLSLSSNPEAVYTLGYNLAKAIAIGVVLVWNFFGNRFWTFSDVGDWGEFAAPRESG